MSSTLSKMDPMVRKLESTVASFKEALSNNDLVSAQQLLRSIAQTSDYLADDVSEIYKSETNGPSATGPNDIYAGGAPVMQFDGQGVIQKVNAQWDILVLMVSAVTGNHRAVSVSG